MKYAIAAIAANLVSAACIACAGYLAANEKPGWGWFLLIALIAYTTVTYETKGEEPKDKDE